VQIDKQIEFSSPDGYTSFFGIDDLPNSQLDKVGLVFDSLQVTVPRKSWQNVYSPHRLIR
jgi:hypothetical protein